MDSEKAFFTGMLLIGLAFLSIIFFACHSIEIEVEIERIPSTSIVEN